MNPISELKQEHIAIEREIFELESIMEDEVINYPNLVHTFRKFCELWNPHERREEEVFLIMERENIRVPTHMMTCEHKDISGHIQNVKGAINLGNDYEIKKSFVEDLRVVIDKVRSHMMQEDEVLYTLVLNEFTEEELDEMSKILEGKSE